MSWWYGWRTRFGLAEVCGTSGAAAGFAVGYWSAGSLLAAAGLATMCEVLGFYGCLGLKTAAAARRATAHLAGWRRLGAAAWHAVTQQLASCAAAETLDDLLIRPGCLVAGAWLLRPLPAGIWLGFAVGKVAADVAWYGVEAAARWTVTRGLTGPGGALGQCGRLPSGKERVNDSSKLRPRTDAAAPAAAADAGLVRPGSRAPA